MDYTFVKAVPVWGVGLKDEKNITLGFYKSVYTKKCDTVLKVATSGVYRVFVNGEFVHFGPARCAHGYFRIDRVPLTLQNGENHVAIEVVCHLVNSYYIPCQEGFIQAELTADGEILASTGDDSFKSVRLCERIRKIQRYSYQRPFAESYNLAEDYTSWRFGRFGNNAEIIKTCKTDEKVIIKRNLPLNKFTSVYPEYSVGKGTVYSGVKPQEYKKDRSLVYILEPEQGNLQGYYEDELELHLSDEVQEFPVVTLLRDKEENKGIAKLKENQFEILSFSCEKTGFICADIECLDDGTLYLLVDEILDSNGDVDPLRMECCNAIKLNVKKGSVPFMSIEPMAFKYLKLLCAKGRFEIKNIHIVETVCPQPIVNNYRSDDSALNSILIAARETFMQNSFDIFMDCPSRERAGWLCDSYFLGIAEHELTWCNLIEKNFLENYLLPDSFKNIPQGMVPMCYPSDQESYGFIPNWAMWLILEIESFSYRSDPDRTFAKKFKNKVYSLLDWFKGYENPDGLLEYLPGWVFVEWSKANSFVQDINYPSNMLYARTLEAVAKIYDDEALLEKSNALKETIRAKSFDGEFFVDNEVYRDGVAVKTDNRTETCQYYAFFTGVATPDLYPELWDRLINRFGPERQRNGDFPEIYPSNAFIGNILRLTLLLQNGLNKQLLNEIKGYYLYMAQTTGTLWEHIDTHASCNHGFASYIAYLIRLAEQESRK